MNPTTTLPRALARAASRNPGRGIGIYDSRGRVAEFRTWAELTVVARGAAARLAGRGMAPGDRAIVSLPTSWGWLEAWTGALFLGVLPVGMAPGAAVGADEPHLHKIAGVAERLGARLLVCGAGLRGELRRIGSPAAALAVTPEELAAETPTADPDPPDDAAPEAGLPDVDPETTAFLQLTSGSTGFPRAVMVPHRAALHNARALDEGMGAPFGRPGREVFEALVSWLPLYHDMGLVGCLVRCWLHGFDLWLYPPQAFLGRPRLWLERLGALGATQTGAPNFGYQLCVERLRERDLEGLDLSGWRAALTGAEMVRPETISAFDEKFGPLGFDRRAFRPCYGLAEGTLVVTLDRRGEGPRAVPMPPGAGAGHGLAETVSTGTPVLDTEVRIVAPDGRVLPEGDVGEIRVKGGGVFSGYYADPEATAAALHDGWLATGDLGFLRDGELYVTGRLKDILIVHGENLMPHELEWAAESAAGGGGTHRAGAFSVSRGAGGEEVVVALEVSERDPEALSALEREVRRRIGRGFSLPLADLVLLRRGRLPKTTSGKVQRAELRQRYLDGSLERLRY